MSISKQCRGILGYLETGRSLTAIEALEKFDCFRLSARIFDLKKQGYKIDSMIIKRNGKNFASYVLSERSV